MKYTQITIRTTTAGSEVIIAQLDMAGAEGVTIADRADVERMQTSPGEWDYIDEEILQSMEEDVIVTAYFSIGGGQAAFCYLEERIKWLKAQDFGFDLGSLEISLATVDDQDWANEWKKYYKPFVVGDKLLIKPFWESVEEDERIVVELNPGMAFGTGTHETTYMCMELIEKHLQSGAKVYDVGCGTGILGIAAIKLGAASVLAIDRDDVAVCATKENAGLNGVSEAMDIQQGDLLKAVEETCDLIIANIIADVIIAFADDAYAHLKSGGTFIASGIIRERRDDVTAAIVAAGYEILETKEKGDWVAIAAKKVD